MERLFASLVMGLIMALVIVGVTAEDPDQALLLPSSPQPALETGLAGSPTPKVEVGEPPGSDQLPDGCSPERVIGIMIRFVDAFNRGDLVQLAAMFRPEVLDADGTPDPFEAPRPGWFVVADEPGVQADNDEELLAWAVARNANSEHWTLYEVSMAGFWWHGGVSIGFDFLREADDLPIREIGGKGAIDCDDGTIFLWAVGSGPVLPDHLFDPQAAVTVVG